MRNRACGLMIGMAVGFAVWGGAPARQAAAGDELLVRQSVAAAEDEPLARQVVAVDEPLTRQVVAVDEPLTRQVVAVDAPLARQAAADGGQERPELKLHALSAVLMDGDSGRILYEKEGNVFRPMASTTKLMTCILALETASPEAVCEISQKAASQPKVRLGAPKGTKFFLKDLLYSLMLESHNDTAVAIAEHVGGSVEGFSQMMNQKARDIGCSDTWFITPNGLDASVVAEDGTEKSHGTTAADLAAILRYCIRESPMKEEFLNITRAPSYSFSDLSGAYAYSCSNHNAFLNMMEGALTGKTGFTGGAGYSYAGALESEGRTFVIALLGSGWPPHKTWKWEDARKLFQYGKEHYHYRDVFEPVKELALPVKNGTEEGFVPVSDRLKEEERTLELLLADWDQAEREECLPESLDAPVRAGDVAGYEIYRLNGEKAAVFPLYAEVSVKRWNFPDCFCGIFDRFFLKS